MEQPSKGKNARTFNPLGPWLVAASEVPDPCDLTLTLTLNGETMQEGNTRDMLFKPYFLVQYISRFMPLEPGDVISTGTPSGVGMGMNPPRYLTDGDVLELTIPGLGRQRSVVQASP